jgi:photosystem II stability/assembly factor-like uncharacterized protein
MNLLKLYSHLFTTSVVICLAVACKKDNSPPPEPPPPVDTLAAGWQKIIVGSNLGLSDVFFVNNNTGWVCGGNYMGKSTDGGLTWTTQQVSTENLNMFNLFFLDEQNGWAVTDKALFKTRNGGSSWQKITVSGESQCSDLQFLNPRLGYLVGLQGLYRSIDSGLTWTKVPGNFNPDRSLHFTDSLKGWVTGISKPAYTSDGGNNFTISNSFTSSGQYAIQFVDANTGWVAGNGGVWRTTDAGANWPRVIITATGGDMHFFNKNDGYICADHQVFKTTNGGQTLTRVAFVTGSPGLVELHFTDTNHGWAASFNNFILRFAQ